MPLLGTCAGFQHIVVEYAGNVLGVEEATHAEYDPHSEQLFITPLACSLAGKTFAVEISTESRAAEAYEAARAVERYCNFGLNPAAAEQLIEAGLAVTGRGDDGEARIIEVRSHRFFVGTLFVPQVSSCAERPHPLVTAFVAAAISHAYQRRAGST